MEFHCATKMETVFHFLTRQKNCVHHLDFGAPITVWLDAAHVYVFGENGDLVALASYAAAA